MTIRLVTRAVPRPRPTATEGANPDVIYVQRQWHVAQDDWATVRVAIEAWWAEAALALRDGIDGREAVARGCDAAQDAVWPMAGSEVLG